MSPSHLCLRWSAQHCHTSCCPSIFQSLATLQVPDSQCIDKERSVMEKTAFIWVQCKCCCNEQIGQGAFPEMLFVFVASVLGSRW